MFAIASRFIKAHRYGLSMAEYRRLQFIFDRRFYLENNPDVYYAAVDPETHYCQSGWLEGRNPCERFNTLWYLSAYDDAAESGLNPLVHYAKLGYVDGRATLPPRTVLSIGCPRPPSIHGSPRNCEPMSAIY